MKHTKKILAILLSVLLLVALVPAAALAEDAAGPAEDAVVRVSISDAGSFVTDKDGKLVVYANVTVSDLNGDGVLDIDETLYAAHEALYPGGAEAGYETSVSEYGLGLKVLWGDDSMWFGYNVNDVGAWGLSDPVKAGDHVYAYINGSAYPDNEGYSYFEAPYAKAVAGEPFELMLTASIGYDETTWAEVFAPCEDAEITVDGVGQDVFTDADGKASITFEAAGTYLVSAAKSKTVEGNEVTAIVAPVCVVKVTERADDADVFVSISDGGTFVTDKDGGPFAYISVTVSDRNADGMLDIDETLYAAHEALYPGGAEAGYETSVSEYGLGLKVLWGDDSMWFGYNVNDVGAWGLSDPVKAGDHVYAYINGSAYPDNEGYSYFEAPYAKAVAGEPFELMLTASIGYDETTWAEVFAPCEGAEITVDYVGQGVFTDADGKASITFEAAGTYLVSAAKSKTVEGNEVTAIVAPVCIVEVTAPAAPDEEPPVQADVRVSISSFGSFVKDKNGKDVAYVSITVTDRNADGMLDIDETLYAAHQALYAGGAAAGYETYVSEYGLGLSVLWGDDSSWFGYNVNDVGAWGLSDPVKAGDHVYAYINESAYPDNEGYAYFEAPTASVREGLPLGLVLTAATGDYDPVTWAAVFAPCEGAEITVDGVGQGVFTDAEGKATISIAEAGQYLVSAVKTKTVEGNEVTAIVAPVCIVTVREAPAPAEGSGAAADETAFVDVPEGSAYAEAVAWAVGKGITTGVDDTHFAPEDPCSRAQALTLLWRAAGSPEPKSQNNPFTDLDKDAYYYKAVLWAYENGITKGITETSFAPDATVSRAQEVTFLFRYAKGSSSAKNPFADVAADAYYAEAVNWAVENKITTGTTATTFSPDAPCVRGQIVTFLYRYFA